MTPWLPLPTSSAATSAGVREGFSDKIRADTPATCGQAMEVPLMIAVAVSLLAPVDVMLEPGAKMSKQEP